MKTKNLGVLVIIQARFRSIRLPGKIMMILDNKPLIQHTIERAKQAINVDKVMIATSTNKADDTIEELCKNINVKCFRGSENDVLIRFIGAAKKYNPKLIVRICGDEPLLDTKILEEAVEKHKALNVDYSTTVGSVPKGLDVEIINYKVLKRLDKEAHSTADREHVTKYILDNPDKFKIHKFDFGKKFARPDIVLTVDTKEDFDFVRKVYHIDKNASAERIIDLVDSKAVIRKPMILIRADGSKKKGMGDLVSCMNIVEFLQEKYECIFVSKEYEEGISFIKTKGYDILPLPLDITSEKEIKIIKEFSNNRNIKYAIIELVPHNPDYVKKLSEFLKIMLIDFRGDIDVLVDILLCWDILAEDFRYNISKDALKLLGPKYVPLGKNILQYIKEKQNNELKNITVVFGGSDPYDLSFIFLEIAKKIQDQYNFTFIIGPGFKIKNSFIEKSKNFKVKFSPKNIYKDFSESDLVISGGGLTSFELSCLGVPFIGISKISWEINRLKKMESLGICNFVNANKDLENNIISLLKELENVKIREKMAENGQKLVDGKGASRIAEAIISKWKND